MPARRQAERKGRRNREGKLHAAAICCGALLTAALLIAGIAVRAEITAVNDETAALEQELEQLSTERRLATVHGAAELSPYSLSQQAEEQGMEPPGSATARFVEPPTEDFTVVYPAYYEHQTDEP
jgi:hypothetical protein